ncbi:hypothetical protein HDE69_002415 [Pedobacter cryoconitis]|uniref:Uncharacterized protein n=1 Tax=Pedobacter cryoconitis TaxID=188932 RepID=A0A7W9DK23_9SPHI|nr:hypothetical protein [Pedobacter cryoconitis]MBB5621354.1 hypothetical protein [Pedobacter cryoconitis]
MKTLFKSSLFYFLFSIMFGPAGFAQVGLLNSIQQPLSPNAAALGKFVEIPMFFIREQGYSQRILKVDSANIEKAENIAQKLLNPITKKQCYLLLDIADYTLLIIKEDTKYRLFTGFNKFNYKKQKKEIVNIDSQIIVNDQILDRSFKDNICNPSFFFMGSIYETNKNLSFETSYIFFVLKIAGIKKYEFNFPTRGAGPKTKFPLDNKIFRHLVKLMKVR